MPKTERWPPGVEPIGVEDLGRLGINADHELFWDGKRIEIRRSLVLTGFERTLAILVAVASILGGIGGIASGLNGASIFACSRGISFFHCPPLAPR